MTNVMIDIETLGTTPGCAILTIAAVPFATPAPLEYFYSRVSQKSCLDCGLHIDDKTVDWWLQQSPEARQEAFDGTTHIEDALFALNDFIGQLGEVQVWGNGASFDVPILEAAYKKCGVPIPWKYYNAMCYRTLKKLFPAIPQEKNLLKHSALEDAKTQAAHAERILKFIKG